MQNRRRPRGQADKLRRVRPYLGIGRSYSRLLEASRPPIVGGTGHVPTRPTRVGAWRVTRITDALRLSPHTPPSRCEVHQVDENLLGRLELLGTAVVAPSGAILFDQGQPGAGVYVLKSGSASLCLLNSEGATVWSRIVGVGAILGLPSTIGGTPYSLRATVIESVEVVFIPKERLIEVMHQDPALASALLKILSDELIDLRRKLSSGAGA